MSEPAFRSMGIPQFIKAQKKAIQDPSPSQKAIKDFVDELKLIDPSVPYVASTYGGTEARILILLSDPGPKTQEGKTQGSGFISHENEDDTAARLGRCLWFAELLEKQAIGSFAPAVIGWNAYPWMVERGPNNKMRAPNAAELKFGAKYLDKLLTLLPKQTIVVLMGVKAKYGWKKLVQGNGPGYRQFLAREGKPPIVVCHPSNLGTRQGQRENEIKDAFKKAKSLAGQAIKKS